MNRKIPYDRGLLLIVLAVVGFGLVMVFSASTVMSKQLYDHPSRILARQAVSVGLGLLVLLLALRIDYRNLARRGVVWSFTGVTLVLLVLPFFFPDVNGAHRWIPLGPLNFQPSELAKIMVVLLTAHFLTRNGFGSAISWRGLWLYLVVWAAMLGLVVAAPDFGTAVSLALLVGFLLFLGGLPLLYFGGALLAALPAFYFLILNVPYRRSRILAFLDPLGDPFGSGYQIRQSLIAVGSGGWKGMGFAEGKQKLFFLPEPHTDFIFAVVGEELGLVGCTGLILLFGLLFWRGVRIALRADTPFGTFVGMGIVCMIVLQALINMSVVVSLLPTKGLPLPFVSAGGSSMIVMLASIGILLNISRHALPAEATGGKLASIEEEELEPEGREGHGQA